MSVGSVSKLESRIDDLENMIKILESNIKGYIDLATAKVLQRADQCNCNKEILPAINQMNKGKEPSFQQSQKEPITPFDKQPSLTAG